LDTGRTRNLCKDSVLSFYSNLEFLYSEHVYDANQIWNVDESGAQAGRNGGGMVIARTGSRNVHSIIPDKREWLSVVACVNAAGHTIPNFYILKEVQFRRNYIDRCEDKTTLLTNREHPNDSMLQPRTLQVNRAAQWLIQMTKLRLMKKYSIQICSIMYSLRMPSRA
jgi:hypothetical protein